MDPDALTLLQDQITAAVLATTNAAADANQVRIDAAADRLAAGTALTLAAQDKVAADAARTNIETQLTAATALIATLQAQITRAVAIGPLLLPGAPPPFTLTPGQCSSDLVLDYSTKEGKGIYYKAVIPFSIIFDGTIKNVHIFRTI